MVGLVVLSSLLRRAAEQFRVAGQWLGAWFVSRSVGQGLVEYGLILVLVMVVCAAILGTIGHTISSIWYSKLLSSNSPFHP